MYTSPLYRRARCTLTCIFYTVSILMSPIIHI